MSKRFPNFSRNHAAKKPKLEISIQNQSLFNADKEQSSSTRVVVGHQGLIQSKKISNDGPNNNIWGDDDDDVILLASQAAEAIEQQSQKIIFEQDAFNIDVTFSKFGEGIQTSTQIIDKPSTKNIQPNNELEDDDDGMFCNIEEFRNFDKIQPQPQSTKKQDNDENNGGNNLFKMPQRPNTLPSNTRPKTINIPSETTKNVQLMKKDSKDIQLNYISSRLDILRKENEKLTKDLKEFNDKLQTKDGEVSVLRHEIRNLKQLNEKICIEKMQTNENIKKEWQDKIHELEKILMAQKSELQFKSAEIHNLKSKSLNMTQHHSNIPNDFNISKAACSKKDHKTTQKLFHLHLIVEYELEKLQLLKNNINIPTEIYENSKFKEQSLTFRENLFHQELSIFQDILAQLQTCKFIKGNFTEKFKNQTSLSLKRCLPELLEYIRNLKYPRYRDTNALVEYQFLCQDINNLSLNCDKTIFNNGLLYPEEKGSTIRRYISALGVLCEYNKAIINEIIHHEKVGEYNLLQIFVESLEMIGFSKEIYHYSGLIESLGYLYKNLIKSKNNNYDNINYLKQLIFCRPNIQTLVQITESLNILSKHDSDDCILLLNKLCTTNDSEIFIINDYYNIIQFSPDSCLLKIYGCQLESAFEQYKLLKKNQINYLITICYNHLQFINNCINKNVKWSLMEQQNIHDNMEQTKICNCYIQMLISFIVLFHLILKQWINDANCIDFRKISKISRCGILLLGNICKLNYRRELIQIGGSSIRNRIKIIYDWLTEHKTLLQFKSAHDKSLELIKTSHIMADTLQNFEEITDENCVSDGNQIWSEYVINNFI